MRMNTGIVASARHSTAFPFRNWMKANLHGVTWKRFGVFCLINIWNALASWPVARALFGLDEGMGAVRAFALLLAIYMVCYGLATLVLIVAANRAPDEPRRWILPFVLAILSAGLASTIFSTQLFDSPSAERMPYSRFFVGWSGGMFEAGIVGAAFLFLMHRDRTSARLQQEEVDRMAVDQDLMQSRLQVLQSQIEPHFLFNTIANIRWLLQTDRVAGKLMLQQFSRYVEAALPQLRDSQSSLGRELALAAAYLSVQQIRMGGRLTTSMNIPDRLKAATFPPMMLITLVENAIKHGLAPLPAGGSITIEATALNDRLTIRVIDSGVGLKAHSGSGIGIVNTRNRLHALHRNAARLSISQNPVAGVTATIEVPLDFRIPEANRP